MNGIRALVATVWVVAAISAGSAHADWQYTKWGMTPADLVKIGNGNIKPVPASRIPSMNVMGLGDALLQSGYIAEGINFDTYYYFSRDDRLVAVSLKTQVPDEGVKLRNLLLGLYGRPDTDQRITGCTKTQWRAEKDRNLVTFFFCSSIDSFEVRYEAIPTRAGGL